MTESNTVSLLRECDSGVQMGVSAIDEVLDEVHAPGLRSCLVECRNKHNALGKEIEQRLTEHGYNSKEPSPLAKGMAWAKTNMKLAMDDSDRTIADLMTDGCSMGIKSLTRCLNQYSDAEESAKDIARRLIALEQLLEADLHPYL